MTLAQIDSHRYDGSDIEVTGPEDLQKAKRKIELFRTERFWPRHPYLRDILSLGLILLGFLPPALSRDILLHPSILWFLLPAFLFVLACSFRSYGKNTGMEWISLGLPYFRRDLIPSDLIEKISKIISADCDSIHSIYIESCTQKTVGNTFLLLEHAGIRYGLGQWNRYCFSLTKELEAIFKDASVSEEKYYRLWAVILFSLIASKKYFLSRIAAQVSSVRNQ